MRIRGLNNGPWDSTQNPFVKEPPTTSERTEQILHNMTQNQKDLLFMALRLTVNLIDLYEEMLNGHKLYNIKKELEEAGFEVEELNNGSKCNS